MRRSYRRSWSEDYDALFEGVLHFADFAQAEKCLRELDEMRQRFLAAGDKKGVDQCILVARKGRKRAGLISRNSKVDPIKRLQKEEIAFWFQVWLETPDLFPEWLRLRKETPEFRALSGGSPERP